MLSLFIFGRVVTGNYVGSSYSRSTVFPWEIELFTQRLDRSYDMLDSGAFLASCVAYFLHLSYFAGLHIKTRQFASLNLKKLN
jgi:hypothetical protein